MPDPIGVSPVRYGLEVAIDYERSRLSGTARITVSPDADGSVTRVPLLLHRLLDVDSVLSGAGRPLPFTSRLAEFEDFALLQVRFFEVELPRPLASGERTAIEVAYSGHLCGYVETGMRYVRDHVSREFTILRPDAFAFPVVGVPSHAANSRRPPGRFDYELSVDVPDDLVVANGGERVGVEATGGRAVWRWRNRVPAWRIDVTVAPYGVLERDGLTVFHFPADAAGAARIAREFARAMETYSEWFGPLPDFAGFTIIEIPEGYGSQADVTSILQTADAFREGGEDRVFELYHEASHLWNVPATDRPAPRWEEGLAMFLQHLLVDHFAGDAELTTTERAAARIGERLRERFAADPDAAATPMADYGRRRMTDLSYLVGMLMFGTLYRRIGADDFRRIVGGFFARYRSTGASTDELGAFADTATRHDLRPFFRDWLFTTGYRRFLSSALRLDRIAAAYAAVEDGST